MADFAEEIERFLASFSPDEVAVMRHTFQAILDCQPAMVAELPTDMGFPPALVEAAVERLTERGLSLAETSHRLILGGRQRYAFCAVDAVGIPVALGVDARVESHCHHCRAAVTLELRDGAVVEATEGVVIWAVERDLSRSLRAYT